MDLKFLTVLTWDMQHAAFLDATLLEILCY